MHGGLREIAERDIEEGVRMRLEIRTGRIGSNIVFISGNIVFCSDFSTNGVSPLLSFLTGEMIPIAWQGVDANGLAIRPVNKCHFITRERRIDISTRMYEIQKIFTLCKHLRFSVGILPYISDGVMLKNCLVYLIATKGDNSRKCASGDGIFDSCFGVLRETICMGFYGMNTIFGVMNGILEGIFSRSFDSIVFHREKITENSQNLGIYARGA